MRFQPFRIELRPAKQVQCVEREPLGNARGAVVFLELGTRLIGEGIRRKSYLKDGKYFSLTLSSCVEMFSMKTGGPSVLTMIPSSS